MLNVTNNTNDGEIENADARVPNASKNNSESIAYIILYREDKVYTTTVAFYNAIRHQVQEIIPAMERGMKYKLEMLCGDAFWRTLSDGDRRMAGRCMAHMVANGLLPLRFAESRHEYPKWYLLIQH